MHAGATSADPSPTEQTPTEKQLRACIEKRRNWLEAKYPLADVEVELEEMVSKYRDTSIGTDPFLIVSRWFKNLPERRSDQSTSDFLDSLPGGEA